MYNRNEIRLEGRITKQGVELQFGATGTAFARFTLAYAARKFDEHKKEWVDGDTSWFECKAFARLAEVYATIPGGTLVEIVGSFRIRYWEAPDGSRREKAEIIVDHLSIPVISEKNFKPEPDGTLVFRRSTRQPAAVPSGIEDAANLFDESEF